MGKSDMAKRVSERLRHTFRDSTIYRSGSGMTLKCPCGQTWPLHGIQTLKEIKDLLDNHSDKAADAAAKA